MGCKQRRANHNRLLTWHFNSQSETRKVSLTKILGSFSVSSSQTVFRPELVGERGWAIVRGLNWDVQNGSPNICTAEVDGGNINIRLTYGTYEIVYGIY